MSLKSDPYIVPDVPGRSRPAPPPPPPKSWQEDRRDQGAGSIADLLITRRQMDRYKRSGPGVVFGGTQDPRLPKLPPQILNPPVIKKPPPKSVLDVINEIIFPRKEEPVADIFGLPHLSDIASGVIDWGYNKVFGVAPPVTRAAAPNFYTGFSWDDSAPEIIQEGFSEAYQFSQDLNVGGGQVAVNSGNGTFLGCPVEESDGCAPSKKRYTITIDNATGQCIKIKRQKSRKRRRRLASLSDIKDIAALKQVLGGGKTLDTWIATRGR